MGRRKISIPSIFLLVAMLALLSATQGTIETSEGNVIGKITINPDLIYPNQSTSIEYEIFNLSGPYTLDIWVEVATPSGRIFKAHKPSSASDGYAYALFLYPDEFPLSGSYEIGEYKVHAYSYLEGTGSDTPMAHSSSSFSASDLGDMGDAEDVEKIALDVQVLNEGGAADLEASYTAEWGQGIDPNNDLTIFGNTVYVGQVMTRTLTGTIEDPPMTTYWQAPKWPWYPPEGLYLPTGYFIRTETIAPDLKYRVIVVGAHKGYNPGVAGYVQVNAPFFVSQVERDSGLTGISDDRITFYSRGYCRCGAVDAGQVNISVIIEKDTQPPTVAITSPANRAVFPSPQITITGSASDNVEVSKVEVSVNNGPYNLASGTTEWMYTINLVKGIMNTITARATDTSGNAGNTTIYIGYVSVEDYFPYYHFSSGEAYYPTSFYFDNDANVSNNHENYDARAGAWNTYYDYVHTVEDKDYFTIQYWLYYAYNYHNSRLIPEHEHDWDSVVYVVFDKNDLNTPSEVRYARHQFIVPYRWDEIEKTGTHPIAYVANGSHGAYPSAHQTQTRNFDSWYSDGISLAPSNWYLVGRCGSITDERTFLIDSETRVFCLPEILKTTGTQQPEPLLGYWPRDFIGDEETYDAPWYRVWRWYLTRPVSSSFWFEIILGSSADLHVYDPIGRHIGMNYETGKLEIEIPNATISRDMNHISIPDPLQGDYRVEVVGRQNGTYDLSMFMSGDEHITLEREYLNVPIAQNQAHSYTISNAFTWTAEIVRSPPGGPATDAISNTFTLDKAYNYTLHVENKGLSGLKMTIAGDGYEYEYKYSFQGDKEYFGEIAKGTLEAGDYTITLAPYGKKGSSTRFVFNVG